MRILLVLMFIVSFGSSAQCFMPVNGGAVRLCATDPGTGQYGPNACTSTQPWLDITGALLPSQNTIDTCTGYWISSASDIRNAQAVEVTPEGFLQSFTFGLTLYLTFWYGPYLVSLARQLINKL